MVLICNLYSHPFETCLNSETRPFHTIVCTGKRVESEWGEISGKSIFDYAENSFSRNIPHPALITLLCIKGGVTFSKTEKKCPRFCPLTLTRVLKNPAHGEKVERARKIKRATTELPMEATSTIEEEPRTKEIGGFEDYLEKSVLSSNAEETLHDHNRAERGKRIEEEQDSNTYELFYLLTEMREEMK